MDTETTSLRIFMFPWLAYGHLAAHLTVAKKFADRGFHVDLCSTPINVKQIKKRITQKYSHSIELVEYHLPELPELPPHYHTTNGLPLHLHSTLKKALKMSKPEFSRILEILKPDLLIYDFILPWVKEVAGSHNIRSITHLTGPAAFLTFCMHPMIKPGIEFPFPALYSTKIEQARIRSMIENDAKEDLDDYNPLAEEPGNTILLLSTSRVIEAKYIDYLIELSGWKIIPVGPPIIEPVNEVDGDIEFIEWLGKKDEDSTVYVSFGSEYFLSKEDMEEIAIGLELSGVNFIWVIRFPKEEEVNLEEALPKGFLERIGNRGKVVDGWAPQPKILSHPSTGGFLSHCGLNSTMESIDFGVPIIAMPIHLDQPIAARSMVELGVAVEIVRDDEGKVHREEVAKVVKSVICEESGENLRKKVREISEKLKSTREEEMDGAVEELIQLEKIPFHIKEGNNFAKSS